MNQNIMMEFDDPDYGINDIERKLEHLQEMFCENIYEQAIIGNDVDEDDLEDALKHFADKEEYEKCVVLKKLQKEMNNEKL